MERIAVRNKRGMTLIEVMVSLLLVTIVSLALIQSSLLAMKANLQNELRDEAVRITEQRMDELRNTPFPTTSPNDLTATAPVSDGTVTAGIRAGTYTFSRTRSVVDVNANSKQVSVTTNWTYGNFPYQHSVSTILRRK